MVASSPFLKGLREHWSAWYNFRRFRCRKDFWILRYDMTGHVLELGFKLYATIRY